MSESTEKTWKSIEEWGEECPECGAGAEVLTSAPDGLAHDCDEARCVQCQHGGYVTVIEEDYAYVNWND